MMEKERMSNRELTQVISCAILGITIALMAIIPTGFVIQRPGPTVDVIDESAEVPAISITGTETFDHDGELRLTTVQVQGGEGFPTWAFNILNAYFRADAAVTPVENVFPTDVSRDEITERNRQEMEASQRRAVVVALEYLDYEVPTVLRIVGTVPESGAADVLQEDDVLLGINGTEVANFAELDAELGEVPGGDTVEVEIERAGEEVTVDVVSMASEDGDAQLGVLLDPDFEFPVDVDINAQDIGGPSAGLIFSLGIVDLLTPGSLTGGESISGTGTIDLAGNVGPIGGIEQKLFGADEAGSDWFLAPEANCAEIENQPDGLTVIPVDTFDNAQLAVESIASGQGDSLPTCESTIEDADEAP